MRKVTLLIALFYFFTKKVNSQVIRANAYYRPFAVAASNLLLDDYPGAAAGYSVARKLDKDFTGNAIRVRRSSDNTEQDVGFVGNELDTSSLKSFVGSNDGFITTIYSQTGSNNATQTTQSRQPRIVLAGVIDRFNGKPSMYFDGGDELLIATGVDGKSRVDAYMVISTSDVIYIHTYFGVSNYLFVSQSGSGSTTISQGAGTPSIYANNSLFSGTTRNDVYNTLNGSKLVGLENFSTSVWPDVLLFRYGSFELTGYVPELIFWDSDQSSNRSGINSNINGYYSIY